MNPTPETSEYEKPEIVDYGDLVELTAEYHGSRRRSRTGQPRPPTTAIS